MFLLAFYPQTCLLMGGAAKYVLLIGCAILTSSAPIWSGARSYTSFPCGSVSCYSSLSLMSTAARLSDGGCATLSPR